MSSPKPLSQPRFEALLYRRSPFTWFLFRELEWWSTEDESLISVITLDQVDGDYGYAILGRDETGVFRGISSVPLLETIDEARQAMIAEMKELIHAS